ncbi:MAG: 4-oxalocrotonate tautomerase family protein [Opitutae bacterium]|nr:4-oxalocrotonate tautomerase family protein [Opitutae bacterium]
MPYVNVQITRGATRAQKQQLVADITRSLQLHLGKKPEQTHIVIDEIDTDNWGFAGMLTTDYLAQINAAKASSRVSTKKKPRGTARLGKK